MGGSLFVIYIHFTLLLLCMLTSCKYLIRVYVLLFLFHRINYVMLCYVLLLFPEMNRMAT